MEMGGILLTICGNPIANMSFLHPHFSTMCGNNKLPIIPPMNVSDITKVDSLRANGPLGSGVLGFWSSKKFAEIHPADDPHDAVNKFPENIYRRMKKMSFDWAKKSLSPQTDARIWRLTGPFSSIVSPIKVQNDTWIRMTFACWWCVFSLLKDCEKSCYVCPNAIKIQGCMNTKAQLFSV